MAVLRCIRGPTNGTCYRVDRLCRVGRAPDNDIVLPDLKVSRYHVHILLTRDGNHVVEDTGSGNHTFVNGKLVTQHRLAPNDILNVGDTYLRYEQAAAEQRALDDALTAVVDDYDLDRDWRLPVPVSASPGPLAFPAPQPTAPPAAAPAPAAAPTPAPAEEEPVLSPRAVAIMIAQRWRLVLMVTLLGAGLSVVGGLLFRPRYEAWALLRLGTPAQAQVGTGASSEPDPELVLEPAEIERRLKSSLSRGDLEAAFQRFRSYFTRRDLKDPQDTLEWLTSFMQVEHRGGNLFRVSTRAKNAELAVRLTSHIAERGLLAYRREFMTSARRTEEFARKQAARASQRIREHTDTMIAFVESHPELSVRSLEDVQKLKVAGPDRLRLLSQEGHLSRRLEQLSRRSPELSALLRERRRLTSSGRTAGGQSPAQAQASALLVRQLADAKREWNELRSQGRTADHPLVKLASKRVKALEARLAASDERAAPARDPAGPRRKRQLQAVNRKIRELQTRLSSEPDQRARLDELETRWSNLRRRHQELETEYTRLQDVAVKAAMQRNLRQYEAQSIATIVDQPRLPEQPVGLSRKILIAAGSLTCLLFALGLAVFLGVVDQRFHSAEQLRAAKLGLELVAVVPALPPGSRDGCAELGGAIRWLHISEVPRGGRAVPAEESIRLADGTAFLTLHHLNDPAQLSAQLFMASPASTPAHEHVRALAARVESEVGRALAVIGVTSWEPRVGRTLVAANLALALAEAQKRVLLIDACCGELGVTSLLGVAADDTIGLCSQLEARLDGETRPWEVLELAETLSLLPASPVDRPVAPLLLSEAFVELLNQMASVFDAVVVDTAPLAERADALAIHRRVSAYLLVAARRRSSRTGLAAAAEQLKGRDILGVVFNELG